MIEEKCIIQLYESDEIVLLGRCGQRVNDLQEALVFADKLAAQLYIEKNRLDRIGRIRSIVMKKQGEF